jgi:hypothetical protein
MNKMIHATLIPLALAALPCWAEHRASKVDEAPSRRFIGNTVELNAREGNGNCRKQVPRSPECQELRDSNQGRALKVDRFEIHKDLWKNVLRGEEGGAVAQLYRYISTSGVPPVLSNELTREEIAKYRGWTLFRMEHFQIGHNASQNVYELVSSWPGEANHYSSASVEDLVGDWKLDLSTSDRPLLGGTEPFFDLLFARLRDKDDSGSDGYALRVDHNTLSYKYGEAETYDKRSFTITRGYVSCSAYINNSGQIVARHHAKCSLANSATSGGGAPLPVIQGEDGSTRPRRATQY